MLRRRVAPWALAFSASATAGCYLAEFDEEADGIFTCQADDDCGPAFTCVRSFCISDEGPSVTIDGPEESSVFDADQAVVFPLALRGSDLDLDEPNGTHEPGRGYLVVEVDGEALPDLVISGSLDGSVTETLDLGLMEGGFHRLRVKAFGLDNEPYTNPSAVADVGIWVNDGEPHIGVRSPWPGDTFTAGAEMDVEVVSLNCTFIDPNLAASDRVDDPVPEGHTHIYLDRREGVEGTLDYPDCLPECNFDYAGGGSIKPDGEAGQTRVNGTLLQVPSESGSLKLTASFNYTGHFPYPSDNLDPALWEETPGVRDQLVNDTIVVELE